MLPSSAQEIVDDFNELSEADRLQLLLEFSQNLPALPQRFGEHPELMEQVIECQSPVFVAVEVASDDVRTVSLFVSAPAEAPTTRGFASVLVEALDQLPADQVLETPDDMPSMLGLTSAITPLRLRGMSGMLARIKRKVREGVA